jgi:hypothetical protein
MSWHLYAFYNANHLTPYVCCVGPPGEKWNRSATARLSLYSADGSAVLKDLIHSVRVT